MKKNIFKTIVCAACAGVLFTGCELDQFPEGSILESESWEQMSDATAYNYGLLSGLRSVSGGSYAYVQELMTDLFNMTQNDVTFQKEHGWTFTSTQFNGDGIWGSNFILIGRANNILNNIDKIKVQPGSNEENTIKDYKGLAHFARAYAYCNMIPRYCKEYNVNAPGDGLGASELGLPLVKTIDLNAKSSRSTLQQTFDFVWADIAAADTLMQSFGSLNYPGIHALRCLEARVCMMQGGTENWERIIEIAEELKELYPLRSDLDAFKNIWLNDSGDETIYQPAQEAPNEQGQSWGIFKSFDSTNGTDKNPVYSPYYIPSDEHLLALYKTKDYRFKTYFTKTSASRNGAKVYLNVYILNKFPGDPKLMYSSKYEYYNACKVFRTAELYLLAAESAYYLGDEDGAKDWVNELREARGLTQNSDKIKSTGEALLADIQEEWTREFVGEGFRLNNLKRWHLGFTRAKASDPNAGAFQKTAAELVDQTLPDQNVLRVIEPNNMRFVWEVPAQETDANPNCQKNWR